MQIFTICHVYAVKGRYEYFFTPNRDVELQEGKVSIEHGKARFTQCVCFLFFWVDPEVSKSRTCLAISLENSSMDGA